MIIISRSGSNFNHGKRYLKIFEAVEYCNELFGWRLLALLCVLSTNISSGVLFLYDLPEILEEAGTKCLVFNIVRHFTTWVGIFQTLSNCFWFEIIRKIYFSLSIKKIQHNLQLLMRKLRCKNYLVWNEKWRNQFSSISTTHFHNFYEFICQHNFKQIDIDSN